ncbi:Cupredoxin [Piptocephalis cylindrospora]|uniref:Cupredoxin n=1 Tax=Piptocephalis cylindrospora TaxID=1907219 RepID=A0A4P9Y7V3_9FUNG|nr:Cupredoxin [Piptocephalis cylindrospora]|eukprot:RKP15085.1 Cupredoxin [Piptocephalis cylindrospora]
MDNYCELPPGYGGGVEAGDNPAPTFAPGDDYPGEGGYYPDEGGYYPGGGGHGGGNGGHGGNGGYPGHGGNGGYPGHGGGKVRKYNFVISEFPASPDGYSRNIFGVNGQYPGPPIIVNKGDKAVINVKNRLNIPTSIHAHGMHQRGTPWFDGVTGGTQCPIQASKSFTYEIDTAYQSGTTWYHSHTSSQYVDGMLGPLIIRDPQDPNRHLYDEELVVVLTDWYHTPSATLLKKLMSPESNGNTPTPDSGLINGKGRFNCSVLHTTNVTTPVDGACNGKAPRETFRFVPGRRYRIRVINASAATNFHFSIDGHKMKVIETDMIPVEPHTIDRLSLHVAQRYSVVVEANAKVDNYWMRAEMATSCYRVSNPLLDPMVLAEVRYAGSASGEPASLSATHPSVNGECVDLDFRSLSPIVPQEAKPATKQIIFDMIFNPDDQGITRAYLNNITYDIHPYSPILQGALAGQTIFPRGENTYLLEKDEEVELVINNPLPGAHPFHLHGHDFQVLSWDNATQYDPVESPKHYNLKNPIRRDTSTVPGRGYTVLRFRADNPGVWAFHCHLEWHVQQGLVANFVEQPKAVTALMAPLSAQALCNGPHVPIP